MQDGGWLTLTGRCKVCISLRCSYVMPDTETWPSYAVSGTEMCVCRYQEVINRGGELISPLEVGFDVLYEHDTGCPVRMHHALVTAWGQKWTACPVLMCPLLVLGGGGGSTTPVGPRGAFTYSLKLSVAHCRSVRWLGFVLSDITRRRCMQAVQCIHARCTNLYTRSVAHSHSQTALFPLTRTLIDPPTSSALTLTRITTTPGHGLQLSA